MNSCCNQGFELGWDNIKTLGTLFANADRFVSLLAFLSVICQSFCLQCKYFKAYADMLHISAKSKTKIDKIHVSDYYGLAHLVNKMTGHIVLA